VRNRTTRPSYRQLIAQNDEKFWKSVDSQIDRMVNQLRHGTQKMYDALRTAIRLIHSADHITPTITAGDGYVEALWELPEGEALFFSVSVKADGEINITMQEETHHFFNDTLTAQNHTLREKCRLYLTLLSASVRIMNNMYPPQSASFQCTTGQG
jgi:uncharacterized coiled-coil protein SlyX